MLLLAAGCASSQTTALEANKDLVRRFVEATNAADWDGLVPLVADDVQRHSAATTGEPVRSRDAFVALQKAFLVSFPDQNVTVNEMIAEGDIVAIRATYSGTNTGPIPGPAGETPATGKRVESPFMGMLRIENGRIAEMWVEWDNVAMLTQLGLFPPGKP